LDKPSGKAPKPPPKKSSALDRLHVRPMLAPGGAGIGLSWEND